MQLVTVTGVNDLDVADELVTLTVSSAGLAPRTVTIDVVDNDL